MNKITDDIVETALKAWFENFYQGDRSKLFESLSPMQKATHMAAIRAALETVDQPEPEPKATKQPNFDYFEGHECGFSSVQLATFSGDECCPMCAEDCGRDIGMRRRTCLDTDRPEGRDARRDSPSVFPKDPTDQEIRNYIGKNPAESWNSARMKLIERAKQ